MNTFVTRLLIVLFLIVAIMTGVLDWIQKRIKKEKHEKFGEASFAVAARAYTLITRHIFDDRRNEIA